MDLKPSLTINDQINLLIKRGMQIDDIDHVYDFLSDNNYYRLNIYFHKFMISENRFSSGINFKNIFNIYQNDQWLRNKLLLFLEPIEIKIKTRIAYHLAMTYGPACFYNEKVYKNNPSYRFMTDSFNRELLHQKKNPVFIHHKNRYQGIFPIWVIVEFLTFNLISKLFSNLNTLDKKKIALDSFGINEIILENWLHCFSVLRNICAHYGYLYKRNFAIKTTLLKEWGVSDNSSLYVICLGMYTLLKNPLWNNFYDELCKREIQFTDFYLRDYGFPEKRLVFGI